MCDKLITYLLLLSIGFLSGCGNHGQAMTVSQNDPSALPSSGIIKATVVNFVSPKKVEVLVSTGIPFALGKIFDEENIAIFDAEGKEISIRVQGDRAIATGWLNTVYSGTVPDKSRTQI